MNIEYAKIEHTDIIADLDEHISNDELQKLILDNKVIVVVKDGNICAWARYNLFWDNTPFLNMIYVFDNYRNQNIGKAIIEFWEKEMIDKGYKLAMTSTLSNEETQHFYRKLGYKDSGSLLLEDQPLEILFTKRI
ncbi:MAG: GNAT family N-acetyltransferase [Bacteroidales bacterium]|jgi:ribosomal protein S18 acetylase RimI-like enzyme|nr:GNAT family N-acetyltransferase [Bacteroidales bacterium]